MGENILMIINNDNLTQEEKDILLKKLAEEYIKEEQRPSKRDLLIEKNRKQAKENRDRLEQINYNSSLKEQMEVLAYLKSNNGEPQFSKSYLLTLRGSELMQIYAECMETMPEAMEKAKEERAKDKAQGVRIFDDYKLGETKSKTSENLNVERKIEPAKEDVPQETTDEHIEDSNVNPKEEIEEEVVSKEENEVQTEESNEEVDENNSGLDLNSLADKMTEDEMNYILDVQKIALEHNVSLNEAEKIFQKSQDGIKSNEPEVIPDSVTEEPISEKIEKKPVQNEQALNRVLVKSLGRTGRISERLSNGLYRVVMDGEDENAYTDVPASDLEITDKEEVHETSDTVFTIDDIDVKEKPGLEDTGIISVDEVEEALRISDERDAKPRKVVTKIVNVINDTFKKAREFGKKAIDNFLGRNKEYVPSEEEFSDGYSKVNATDEDIMSRASSLDATPEDIAKDLEGNLSNKFNGAK